MKVKIILDVLSESGEKANIEFEAILSASFLETENGYFNIQSIQAMRIDCMPNIRKENQDE